MTTHVTKFGNTVQLPAGILEAIDNAVEQATQDVVKNVGGSANNAIVVFDGLTGSNIKSTSAAIDTFGNMDVPGYLTLGVGGADYSFPLARGGVGAILKDPLGDGNLIWGQDTSGADQSLNTTDTVTFAELYIRNTANNPGGAALEFIKNKGSNTSLNDTLGEIDYSGISDAISHYGSIVSVKASENWGTGSGGAEYIIFTSDNGTLSPVRKVTIGTGGTRIADGTYTPKLRFSDNITDITNGVYMTYKNGDINNGIDINDVSDNNIIRIDKDAGLTSQKDITAMFELITNLRLVLMNGSEVPYTSIDSGTSPGDMRIFNAVTGRVVAVLGETSEFNKHGNTTQGLELDYKRSRGTSSLPLAIQNLDTIHNTVYKGFNGISYSDGASIECEAKENYTVGSHGTKLMFNTCDIGEAGLTTRLTIDKDVIINNDLKFTKGPVSIVPGNERIFLNDSSNVTIASLGATIAHNKYTNGPDGAYITSYRARGTSTAPLPILSGDLISAHVYSGRTSTGNSNSAYINCKATEDFTSSINAGCELNFQTKDNSTAGLKTKLILNSDGVTIPDNDLSVIGGSATITGTVTHGITGAGTHYIMPDTKGNTGEHLRLNGNLMEWAQDAGGDVFGPDNSLENEIPKYSGTTGKYIQTSNAFVDGGQMSFAQGFQSNLSLPYLLYNNNQTTYTVTGTGLTDLIPNIINSFFPVNSGNWNWLGKKVKIVIKGTMLNANNEQMYINIGFLNSITTAHGTGTMPTANIAPGKKVTFTFEVDFRTNPSVLLYYQYFMDLSILGGSTQWVKSASLTNTIDQTVSNQQLYIRAYWSSDDINNQFLCRTTEVYII